MNEFTNNELKEFKSKNVEGFESIKSVDRITPEAAKSFIDNLFSSGIDKNEEAKVERIEKDIDQVTREYINDLKNRALYPETIPDPPFRVSDLKKRTPEENVLFREEFEVKKAILKREWEIINGKPWPKYDRDVYSSNGKLIRRAGDDLDAHHNQPLVLGGTNTAENITPIHAEEHYDRQGIHSTDSPYEKLNHFIGGYAE